jgi:hypothetical protein
MRTGEFKERKEPLNLRLNRRKKRDVLKLRSNSLKENL